MLVWTWEESLGQIYPCGIQHTDHKWGCRSAGDLPRSGSDRRKGSRTSPPGTPANTPGVEEEQVTESKEENEGGGSFVLSMYSSKRQHFSMCVCFVAVTKHSRQGTLYFKKFIQITVFEVKSLRTCGPIGLVSGLPHLHHDLVEERKGNPEHGEGDQACGLTS